MAWTKVDKEKANWTKVDRKDYGWFIRGWFLNWLARAWKKVTKEE